MERIYPMPVGASHYHLFTEDSGIKCHPGYKAAKAGDPDAALALIEDLAVGFLVGLRGIVPADSIFVSPYAKEATGDNALPLILSLVCSQIFGG